MSVVPLVRAALTTRPASEVIPGYDGKSALEANTTRTNQVFAGLIGYIRGCFEAARTNRQTNGVDDRLLAALRAMRGQYDDQTLADIKAFGGSEVYARITAGKVRGTSALLREIYVSATDRPWALEPTPLPDLPGPTVEDTVNQLLQAEVMEATMAGGQATPEIINQRKHALTDAIMQARRKQAEDALRLREQTIDDILWEGGFYSALWEFLGDVACFPYAVVKGPVVRMRNALRWEGNTPVMKRLPVMTWERCSPFDVWFAPWAQHPQDGYIIHRMRVSQADLRALRELPNYSPGAIDRVLDMNPSSLTEWFEYVESERAHLEQRENDRTGDFGNAVDRPLPLLEFHGPVTGQLLIDWGMPESEVVDPQELIDITAYVIGSEVIGVRKNPHPAGRKPFYVDSFERVPGSPYGNGIPDLIDDIQSVANATLRALVNNMAIASGPIGFINEDRLAENDPNASKLWPWKMYRTTDSMNGGSDRPIDFFQPSSNAEVLLGVYERFAQMADEMSSLPRYMQGNAQGVGGAGRTASGLSMLMEASNRTIKQTIASIDQNVVERAVEDLNVYLALTRPDIVVEGDLSVKAKGAVELVQRETLRMRRLEFLNITGNPIDAQLVGLQGRHAILQEIARDLGLPVAKTLPINPEQAMMQAQAAAMAQAQGGGQQGQAPKPGEQPAAPVQNVARTQNMNPGG